MKDEGKRNVELLSRREKEVVQLLLHGRSNKQIAFSLGVSERTVEFHLRNIYTKLQVASRVELILKLGKTPAGILPNPVESTVDAKSKITHNDSQPIARGRWAYSLRNIKQEAVMTVKSLTEDIGTTLRDHPLFFIIVLFLAISLTTHYVLFGLGLYFWLSYVLLGIILCTASIYFGLSWKNVFTGKFHARIHPLIIIIAAALLPLFAALLDEIYLHTLLKNTGAISFTLGALSTKAAWMTAPEGYSYLYTERHTFSDDLWLLANLCMIALFLAGLLSNRWFKKKDPAPA
jgi:DNA-binding CsgD family transcriptional regulator